MLDAALELAAEEGIDGLSMRKLAKRLGVEAMSLYNHVSSKSDILDGIAERVQASIERPDPAKPWPERIRETARNMYRAMKAHPVVPLALVRDEANPLSTASLLPLDDAVAALFEAGMDEVTARQSLSAMNSLVFGSLLLATGGFEREYSTQAEANQLEPYLTGLDHAKVPHFSRLLPAISAGDPEEDFEAGLDMLIAGIVKAAGSGPSNGMGNGSATSA